MRQQPDFEKLFFDYFGDKLRKVTYEVRQDSNRGHDIVFLSSLIHDARFKMTDVNLRGKRLTININRDCWEHGFCDKNLGNELYIADSKLTISSVLSLDWRFDGFPEVKNSDELWIRDITYNAYAFNDVTDSIFSYVSLKLPDIEDYSLEVPRHLVIRGHTWSLQITLLDDKIKLADKEKPYLYTEREKELSGE